MWVLIPRMFMIPFWIKKGRLAVKIYKNKEVLSRNKPVSHGVMLIPPLTIAHMISINVKSTESFAIDGLIHV